jgi:hypothetical protein
MLWVDEWLWVPVGLGRDARAGSRCQMTWARSNGSSTANDEDSRMGLIRAEEAERLAEQNDKAVITVAGHSSDVTECAELLAMLGLDASSGRHRTVRAS